VRALQSDFDAGIIRSLVENEMNFNGSERFDGEKKEVDEHRETLHNLASLLLTNKTIRKRSKAVPNTVL
jgi:hypothetical protein